MLLGLKSNMSCLQGQYLLLHCNFFLFGFLSVLMLQIPIQTEKGQDC